MGKRLLPLLYSFLNHGHLRRGGIPLQEDKAVGWVVDLHQGKKTHKQTPLFNDAFRYSEFY